MMHSLSFSNSKIVQTATQKNPIHIYISPKNSLSYLISNLSKPHKQQVLDSLNDYMIKTEMTKLNLSPDHVPPQNEQ